MICNSCPRKCNIDRERSPGYCRSAGAFRVARAALHFWEEPCISGKNGSGTVFFSGCNLRCVYCQNYEISRDGKGVEVSDERLIGIFEALIKEGAENINLVNPTHYADRLCGLLKRWKSPVPIVWNTSGYESAETLKRLSGLVDIYLTDLKYIRADKAKRYSSAEDYFSVVKAALSEMTHQLPSDEFTADGIMKKGVIIRHLILPSNTNSSLEILDFLNESYKDRIISLMAQYTPCGELGEYPEINRKITKREYEKVASYAEKLGFGRIFLQKLSSADKNFIPAFDFSGIM
ncbi:MAG: radical SAM protein [Eubacterium sp.]|nr:radical SAM protein [Eubacterium sp.]